MRVIFTAHGAYGHVLPLVGVARALAERGHVVLVATSPNVCPVVTRHGLVAQAAGMDDEAVVAEARRRWPWTLSDPPEAWTTRMFCEIAAPAMVADLEPLIAGWRPDLVVREEGELGAPVAAAAAGVPWVTHGWGSPLRSPEALAELARLMAPMSERAGLRALSPGDLYGEAVLDPCPPSLYGGGCVPAGRQLVRPTTGGRHIRPSRATGRPLAYVGFGTVPLFRDAPTLLRAVVAALLRAGFGVTVTTGDAQLGSDLAAMGPGRVTVERWLPLARLVPQRSLVVCHGGAGTVLAALAAGVPLLLPRGAPSQMRMSAACEARGVGRVVRWDGAKRRRDQSSGGRCHVDRSVQHGGGRSCPRDRGDARPPSAAAATLADVVGDRQ